MFSQLQRYLTRPELYARTQVKFWNDPHIAAQMLKAHLDPTTDAASFRPEFIDRSVEWILSLLPCSGARVLDVGCGPGLYTRRFAQRGLCATGVDFSENSLSYARAHDPQSEYILKDYLTMEAEDAAFDLVTMIQCDYGALIPHERRNLLSRIHRALKPGGLFLLDVFTPFLSRGKREDASWALHAEGGFWSPNPHICLDAEYHYGGIARGRRVAVIEDAGVRCFNLWDCYFTRQSLLREVSPMGFSEAGFYGDVSGSRYDENAPQMCAVLAKTGQAEGGQRNPSHGKLEE